MTNAKAELNKAPGHSYPNPPRSVPNASANVRPDDEIRDFFRRGNRGQYEGGLADKNSPSIPTWDMPESNVIVRTPRQRARRAVLAQVVAMIVAACLVLLVTAARVRPQNGNAKQTVTTLAANLQPAVVPVPQPRRDITQQFKPPPMPVVAPSAIPGPATTANSAALQSQIEEVATVTAVEKASEPAPFKSAPIVAAVHREPKTTSTATAQAPRTRPARSEPVPAPTAPVARKAVAAFPDD